MHIDVLIPLPLVLSSVGSIKAIFVDSMFIVGGCKLPTSFALPLNGPSMKSMVVCLRVGNYGLVNTGIYQSGDMTKNHCLSSLLQPRFGLASAQSHLAIAMASHSLALWLGLVSQTLWD